MAISRTSVYLDETSAGLVSGLPRSISVSAIVRVCLVAMFTNDREFTKYLKDNPEAKEVKDWMKPKLRKLME